MKNLGEKMDSILPCPQKKTEAHTGPCGHRAWPDWAIMMWMFPPAPTPFPLPSKAQTFWAFCLCQGWGWVGARGEFGIGNWLPPPLPPFPWHNFFRGVPREGGLREALRCLDLPRSLPHLSTPGSSRSWRGLDSWGREAGGGAGTRYQRPPYHPEP